jgi:hypothetical protein
MTYTLWDTETSNQFGQFQDEKEVLVLVRTLLAHYGPQYARDLGLGRVTAEGVILEPLSGGALIARVEAVLSDDKSAGEDGDALVASRRQDREIA